MTTQQSATRAQGRGFAVLTGLAMTLLLPSAQAQSSITTCPYVITEPGTYEVEADLNCSGDGIDIQASDVTLNLNNHIIAHTHNSPSGFGINVQSATALTNVKVNGPGYVRSFTTGLFIQNVSKSQFQKVTFGLNNLYGIFAENVSGLVLNADIAGQNGDGIVLDKSINGVIQGCDASATGDHGILLVSGSGNQVQKNTANGNGYGILLSSESPGQSYETSDQVRDNTTIGNVWGIQLDTGASGNHVGSNTSVTNRQYDLYDGNTDCGTNQWRSDSFYTNNQPCAQ
jgi:parallel beta-helix repeat protein